MKALKVTLNSPVNENESKLQQEWKIDVGKNFEKTYITIQDGTISRVHAELSCKEGGDLFITDLSSANGTYIDGEQIETQKQIKVNVNSKINLGDSKFFLSIAEYEPEIEAEPIQEKPKEKEETKVSKRERSRSRSNHSYSLAEKDRRKRDREDKSRRHKKSEEKGVDRYREKRREKYRRSHHKSKSNQRWKKSKSPPRRQSRSKSRSRQHSRKYKTQDNFKQDIIVDQDLKKNSSEIQSDNPKDNWNLNKLFQLEDDKKDSNLYRKKSNNRENKNYIDEKLSEEIERKKKFLNEFLRVKESELTDLKLKLPKLIEKEKVADLNEAQNENSVKPNLSDAFKKLEEAKRLKVMATQSLGYSRNGNNNINIDRRESSSNYSRRVNTNSEGRNKYNPTLSTWRKNN